MTELRLLTLCQISNWPFWFIAFLLTGCNGSSLSSHESLKQLWNDDNIENDFSIYGKQAQLRVDQDNRILQSIVTLPFRMNCGNTTTLYTDPSSNKVWLRDQYFTGTEVWNGCPEAARLGFNLPSHLCQTRQQSSIEYYIPVPYNGAYKLTLYFVETIKASSKSRVFNVQAEGTTLLSNLDVFRFTGGRMRLYVRTFTVTVADGFLWLRLSASKDKAMISAIEIEDTRTKIPTMRPALQPTSKPSSQPTKAPITKPSLQPTKAPTTKPSLQPTRKPTTAPTSTPVKQPTLSPVSTPVKQPTLSPVSTPVKQPTMPSPATPSLSTVRINCGGFTPYIDLSTNNTWSGDVNFQNGSRYMSCPADILNTDIDTVYCSERWFGGGVGANGTYTIPVVPGKYTVRLLFAELFYNNLNSRVFNVYLQNRLVRSNLDIRAVTGGRNISLIVPAIATVLSLDPNVRVTLQNIVQNAKISGIEIVPYDGSVTDAPTYQPTRAPTRAPTNAFQTILINCGYNLPYTDSLARLFSRDQFFVGGTTTNSSVPIANTEDDILYQFNRVGDTFTYEIPVPIGSFAISLLFSENEYNATGQRMFDITIEGETLTNVDIFQIAGGAHMATRLQKFKVVDDNYLSIRFTRSAQYPNAGLPKLNGIEVALDQPHIAHAVATGPYVGTVVNSLTNTANVQLVGQTSHTHGEMLSLTNFTWKEGSTILGTNINTNFSFGAGVHTVSLTIRDNGGNTDTESTTVRINPFGFPAINSLIPSGGNLTGQYPVTISGSGFNFSANQIKIMFGTTELTGSEITVINQTTIQIIAPSALVAQTVDVTVQTPLGISTSTGFNYVGSIPIVWQEFKLLDFFQPTVGRFGPDSKLYIGTRYGRLLKVTMNSDFTSVVNTIVSYVNPDFQESMYVYIVFFHYR
jgi:Malectin domain/IPT/TIG domain